MPQIIPIRDLKNTSDISKKCHSTNAPIFITKNGYGDMVIMSLKTYEENILLSTVYGKLGEAEKQFAEGKVLDGDVSLKSIREKHGL